MGQTTNNTEEPKLLTMSISVSGDGLCFYDSTSAEDQVLHSIKLEDANPVELEEQLKNVFATQPELAVRKLESVYYKNPFFSIVPKEVFDADYAADYLKYNTKLLPTDVIEQEISGDGVFVTAFVPYTNINNLLLDYYEDFSCRHSINKMYASFKQSAESVIEETTETIYIHCERQSVYVFVFRSAELLLANTYHTEGSTDIAYYTLLTLQETGLNQEATHLYINAENNLDEALTSILKLYVAKVLPITLKRIF